MFEDASILVTGGTGSFGQAFARMTLQTFNPKKLVIFSRDEMKHWQMAKTHENDKRVRFFRTDVIHCKSGIQTVLDFLSFKSHMQSGRSCLPREMRPGVIGRHRSGHRSGLRGLGHSMCG